MKVFGLAGWSGSGKTTLMVELIPLMQQRGVSVSTIKHAHHGFDIDHPGKDSHRHRGAGATEVLVASARRWALIHELRDDAPEPPLSEHLARLSPVDLVLVEGFKRDPHPKLEVWRQSNGKPFLHPEDARIVAVATDVPVSGLPLPRLALDDLPAIADFIQSHCGLKGVASDG